ncbi:MAG: threonine/serine dehydratase [Lautropia sp.]
MPVQHELSADRIRAARRLIDPVFLDTPLLADPGLDRELGFALHLKLETENPIRSFKGRGTGLFVATELAAGVAVVAASAGNFGQGLAYNAGRRSHSVTIFAADGANTAKIEAMRRFGAEVVIGGADFDAAKALARSHAERHGQVFVEDGASAAIAEGAGTIAAEITDAIGSVDAVLVPLGNGALATGVGCWLKAVSPATRVIAVAAERAPCMALSWRAGRVVPTATADTIGDGIAVRLPVPFALASMRSTIDDVLLVSDQDLLAAMHFAHDRIGRLIEPAGAAGLAGLLRHRADFAGRRVATVLCGANLTARQIEAWFGAGA